jgi:hypothetical protein
MLRNLLLTGALVASSLVAGHASTAIADGELDDTPWTLPATPPRCSVEQAESGDVAGCMIAFYHDPADTGWGAPPAPGVGSGWNWQGWTYNGSSALAGWEATYIAANAEELAGLAPQRLETHVAAQALFEGFLEEIDFNGYRVRDASGYSFRCTSGSGGWSCPSGNPDDLSNHAWGLAIDMNAGTNPIRRYYGIDGNTACATPMQTDMPHWVIQTAEKWGLYWGGYGWNSGCADTTTQRTSVYRDPPHFEFRGTPEQARAIADFNLRNDPRTICIPIVDDEGNDAEHCSRSSRPPAATRLPVEVDAPTGATAALINLTAVGGDWYGYLTLEDCGPQEPTRTTSSISFAPGQAVATMAVVPLADGGRFCVYRSTSVHSLVDVVAYLGADGEPLWFDPSPPTRLTDTRRDGSCAPLEECHDGPVPDFGEHVVPTSDGAARIANIAVIHGRGPGYVQAGRCGGLGPEAGFSNLNFMDAAVRSNLALMDGGDEGSCVFALTEAHVIVDELGRLDAESGYGWQLTPARRALDTRECAEAWCAERPAAGELIELDLGTSAPGAAIAITVTDTQGPGYVWVGPCSDMDGLDTPTTSNLNHMTGQTVTNLALVEVEAGTMCIYTKASAHVIIDVQAELVDDHEIGLLPVAPTRAHDSRDLT